jgi:hypothetical protein
MKNKVSTNNNNKVVGKSNVGTYTSNKVIKNSKGNDKQHGQCKVTTQWWATRWCWVVKGDGSITKQWWVVTRQQYSTKNKHKTIKYTQKQAKK